MTIHTLTDPKSAARPLRPPSLAEMSTSGLDRPSDQPTSVLVIDDSAAQRRLISRMLTEWGYMPISAAGAAEALALLAEHPISLVVCDWMMPEISGPEFCAELRKSEMDGYAYVILLTSKTGRDAIAVGLESGADDFLRKPVHPPELLARLRAGARILQINAELKKKNNLLHQTLEELSALYVDLDRDLQTARDMQHALLRDPIVDLPQAQLAFMLRASGHVGGDLVGYFPAGEGRIGMFSLDVSGHGVSAAMITARLASLLAAHSAERNLCLRRVGGRVQAVAPVEVARSLNRMMLREDMSGHYFTLCYVLFDLTQGTARFIQAGHPLPLILDAHGAVREVGQAGLPIGLLEDADWVEQHLTLAAGDRLFLYSDGWVECPNHDGVPWSEAGLCDALMRNAQMRGQAMLDCLAQDLEVHLGSDEFLDDISAAVLHFHP